MTPVGHLTCQVGADRRVSRRRLGDLPVADEIRVLELVVKANLPAVHGQAPAADGAFVVAPRFASELSGWGFAETKVVQKVCGCRHRTGHHERAPIRQQVRETCDC